MTHVRLRLVIGVILLSYTFGAYVYHVGLSIFYPISSSTSPLEGHESDFPPPAPVPQILPPHSLPNVWDKGVLFMVLLAFFPRIVLLVGTRMEFDLNSIIRWSLTPEMQVLHMARSNGYQHSNPIVFYCFAIYATFSGVYQLYGVFHKYITAPLPATATGEAPQLITLGQLTAINRGIALGFFSLKAKYTQLQQRLNMLEANPETIQSLNYPQLVNLRNILQEKLEAITEKVREKAPRGNMPDQTDIPDSCIACMASTPCVKFLPCSHVCFCLDCFNRYKQVEREEDILSESEEDGDSEGALSFTDTKCPVCRTNSLSVEFTGSWVSKISMAQYYAQGVSTTAHELAKLTSYVKKHPKVLKHLADPTVFDQYM